MGTQDDLRVDTEKTLLGVMQSTDSYPTLSQTLDPLHWWTKFAEDVSMASELRSSLLEEINSSYVWQSTCIIYCGFGSFVNPLFVFRGCIC